jgi:CubicO group peptidase (beta-lactamase class C family)
MHVKKRLTTIAAVATVLLSSQIAAGDPTRLSPAGASGAIDGIVEQRMKEAGLVGLGAAIIVNKRLVWTKGYGFADKEHAVPFTPDTVMNIGSISKTFTGVALMRAVQDGRLSLDDDINTYLPFKVNNPFFPNERITLRQLATHTSGITDRPSIYEGTYHYGGDSPEPLGEFLRSYLVPNGKHYSRDNFLNAKPGTHREYSNIAAGLAGYIVETAVGEKLNVYTRQHIFSPLKMNNTGWFLSEIAVANHSKLYVAQGGLTIPIQLYGGTTYPDGGVRTSVADLSKFFIALLNEGEYEGTRILEKRSVDEMLRLQYTDSNRPENVVLKEKNSGIFWSTKFDVTRIGHGGSDPGVKTEMLADLSKDVGVILFTNTSGCEMRTFYALFEDLWKHAVTLKEQRRPER